MQIYVIIVCCQNLIVKCAMLLDRISGQSEKNVTDRWKKERKWRWMFEKGITDPTFLSCVSDLLWFLT